MTPSTTWESRPGRLSDSRIRHNAQSTPLFPKPDSYVSGDLTISPRCLRLIAGLVDSNSGSLRVQPHTIIRLPRACCTSDTAERDVLYCTTDRLWSPGPWTADTEFTFYCPSSLLLSRSRCYSIFDSGCACYVAPRHGISSIRESRRLISSLRSRLTTISFGQLTEIRNSAVTCKTGARCGPALISPEAKRLPVCLMPE